MRRSLILVLVGVVALTIGCSKQEPAPAAPVGEAPAAAPAPAETPATPPAAPAAKPPAAASTVVDLPDYPGAVRVAFSQKAESEKGFTSKAEASWTSADPYATVVAYYQKVITDKGWTVTGTKSKATEIEWQLTKGTSVGKVEVKQGAPVTIKIERSDR